MTDQLDTYAPNAHKTTIWVWKDIYDIVKDHLRAKYDMSFSEFIRDQIHGYAQHHNLLKDAVKKRLQEPEPDEADQRS